jgi:hypothetical protein
VRVLQINSTPSSEIRLSDDELNTKVTTIKRRRRREEEG